MINNFKKILRDKVVLNSAWMILEKLISILGLIFVTSYVAKYIGPVNFGKLTFVTTIFIVVQSLSLFGTEHIILKRVSKNMISGMKLMRGTVKIRHLTYFILSLITLIYLKESADNITLIFGMATAVAYYFASIDIYAIYNNAMLNSRINTICNIIGLVISLTVRYIVVYFQLDIGYLSLPIVMVTLIPYLLKKIIFNKINIKKAESIKNQWKYSKYLFKAGFPLSVSTVSSIIYTRVSLFFIMFICGAHDLGIFSVASQLATSWMFFTSAIITSYFTRIYSEKDSYKALIMASKLNGVVFIAAACIICIMLALGKFIIFYLYGSAYRDSYYIMVLLCINTFFSSMGPVASKLIIYKSGYAYLSNKMFITIFIALPLTFYLTKNFGITGAAISSICIEFISLTLLNYFFKNGLILKMQIKTFSIFNYFNK